MAEWAATFGAIFEERDGTFEATLAETNGTFEADFGEVYWVDPHPLPDPYEGPYVVIPKVIDQYLATNNKRMTDDVTVTEIPYVEISNLYGTTVSIATE